MYQLGFSIFEPKHGQGKDAIIPADSTEGSEQQKLLHEGARSSPEGFLVLCHQHGMRWSTCGRRYSQTSATDGGLAAGVPGTAPRRSMTCRQQGQHYGCNAGEGKHILACCQWGSKGRLDLAA